MVFAFEFFKSKNNRKNKNKKNIDGVRSIQAEASSLSPAAPNALNVPHSLFGVWFSPVLGVDWVRRQQTLAALHYVFVFFLSPPFCMFTSFGVWLLLLYIVWLVFDWKTPRKGGRGSEWVLNWSMWKHLANYFPMKLHKTVDLPPDRNYVFGYHPHGVSAVGAFTHFAVKGTDFRQQYPGLKPHLLTLVGNFWYPLRREYGLMFDACECSKPSMRYLLTRPDKGHCAVVVVGGASEAVLARPGRSQLVLTRRHGFIKMAIQHGADLVPIYSFGENGLFEQFIEPDKGLFARAFKRVLGVPLLVFYGRGMFNYSFGLLPNRKPINTVVGAPISVEQIAEPSRDQVAAVHAQYVKALRELFDSHKQKYGDGSDLELVA